MHSPEFFYMQQRIFSLIIKVMNCNYYIAKRSFYRVFNAIYGNVRSSASVEVVVELLKMKCMPILLYGLDACPVSSHQLRSLNYVVVSRARKIFNISSSEIAAECIKCLELATSLRPWPCAKDRFIERLRNLLCYFRPLFYMLSFFISLFFMFHYWRIKNCVELNFSSSASAGDSLWFERAVSYF